VNAVRDGRFHVWAVRHVDEGIEILTGAVAGARDDSGRYPEDSINGRIAARLAELGRRYRQFSDRDERRDKDDRKPDDQPPASLSS